VSVKSANKSVVGRQAQLPLHRAFKISMNSLKIRFWRSMVTAGGIFLGIAFLATVLTQYLMQWPVAPKVEAGFVQLDGQINGPGAQEVFKPIPVGVGREAGIPEAVIKKSLLPDKSKFSLTTIITGQLQEKRAIKNLARVKKEWEGLRLFEKDLPLYLDILGGKDIKIADAVKAGVPQKLAKKAAAAAESCSASAIADYLKKTPGKIEPIYVATALDKDISPADALKAGIPSDLVAKAVTASIPPPPAAPAPDAAAPAAAPANVAAEAPAPAAPAAPAGPPPPAPGMLRGKALNTVLNDNPDLWTESKVVKKLRKQLPVFASIADAKDVKADDAIKAGLPKDVVRKMEREYPLFHGSDMVDILREDSDGLKPIYAAAALDQDISISDGDRAGVPHAISKMLAGSGKAFKATALNDAIKIHPTWIKIWESRLKRNKVFTEAKKPAIDKLAKEYAITLNEALVLAKNPDKHSADMGNVMIVNQDGRRISANFLKHKTIGSTKLASGDYILIPDRNSWYRMIWLVVMSLLVCTVGITNSMLMAVTERFKEIGTMKCLGALDTFVVLLFMLESGMLGICASVLGWILGFVAMVLIAGMSKGWDIVATMSIWGVFATLGICVAAGMILTLFATIMPARQAARMPAAMALRSEI